MVEALVTTLHDRAAKWLSAIAVLLAVGSPASAQVIVPDNPGAADVRLTVNSTASVKAISPYVYGRNFYNGSTAAGPVTMDRLGGNRWTGYNWENNFSNAGADWFHHSDRYLSSSTTPGEAVRPSLVGAAANNRALVVTVPMAGYVAADDFGTVDETEVAPSPRWKSVVAKKSTIYPGQALSTSPDKNDGYVFTDEFVNWVESTKTPSQQVFYSLDNEPGIWGEPIPAGWQSGNPNTNPQLQPTSRIGTHPLIHPSRPTFAEMRSKTIANATAIKDVNPNAIVFGGVGYGWQDFVQLQDAPDKTTSPSHGAGPNGDWAGELHYNEWLLQQMAAEEAAQGRPLMDALDLHWYSEANGGGVRISDENSTNPSAAVIQARVQAPRSLWDPTYGYNATNPALGENSWIAQWSTQGPIRLLPRVQRDIDAFKPGTKIAITEYNYGGGQHISGGIAQADALGIFGREGVFAASMWPLAGDTQTRFAHGAFKMYLNYDGAGGQFGDTSVSASTTVIADSSVYASLDSEDPSKVIVVAINRTASAKTAAIQVTHDQRLDLAEVYQLTSASSNPVRASDVNIDLVNAFLYTMPAYSVSTLELRTLAPGDFNGDASVDAADLAALKANFGLETGAAYRQGDYDRDGDVDGADVLGWQMAAGNPGGAANSAAVPEPCGLTLTLLAFLAASRRRTPLRSGR
jgi:hypothetical protein